ncbi:ribbon-helix-helix domain-containing protein [Devosia sp. BK]|uniref:ribbon-helix-helix domain-containing protein n=1 Tax=Devosia sp. BK TaxID=2871706 RepID=UPI002939E476|nr:ribbon-helix-helix domain-containing protein [Devosia sp. BK]MDV3250375.1 ribbon-helix-helix domain-containing protein [Devosia sp. BK]
MQKRSFSIAGHRTSIALEADFWTAFEEIASQRNLSLAALVREIDETREAANLSSAIRLHILRWYRDRATTAPAD